MSMNELKQDRKLERLHLSNFTPFRFFSYTMKIKYLNNTNQLGTLIIRAVAITHSALVQASRVTAVLYNVTSNTSGNPPEESTAKQKKKIQLRKHIGLMTRDHT